MADHSSDDAINIDEMIEKCEKIRKNAENAIKSSNELPCADFVLYQSYAGFSKVMDHESGTILKMLQALVKDEKVQIKRLFDASAEEKFDMIVEMNDAILDRIGNVLDEAEGLKKKNEDLKIATINVPTARKTKSDQFVKWNEKSTRTQETKEKINLVIRKPQLLFEDKIDNFNIFEPIIKFKHNSIKPLSIIRENDDSGESYFANPYEVEITSYKLLDKYLEKVNKPQKPSSIEETRFQYVDKFANLNQLLDCLRKVHEFAVDLEFHNHRSFLGFICLMQISTRDQDFVIDTIVLRSHMHILNEVFTDPKILKVFHGADLDIRLLQKDFGIYVVNMFDTGQAARLLRMASFSLSFLCKHYCDEVLIKKYQLADWRARPLSSSMLHYARSDTHWLLYIFDRMRNDLIDREGSQLLSQAFEESRKICLSRFEVTPFYDKSYARLMMKNRVEFNNRQRQALKDLYSWRDNLARREDESTNYVLPNHMMLKIAEVLPQEQQGILACCNPIPAMVRKHLNELHLIVLTARELPLKKTNDQVYLLKPIVNQTVDITSNMDILDEEHSIEHHFVKHDCLLDTPEMLHEIKLHRPNESVNLMLGNFFAQKSSTVIVNQCVTACLTPFVNYCKWMESKLKKQRDEYIASRVHEIDINQVPEIVSKEITNEQMHNIEEQKQSPNDLEEELTKRLDVVPLIEINKKRKIKHQVSEKQDIPCSVNRSLDNLIEKAMESSDRDRSCENKDEVAHNEAEEIELDDAQQFGDTSEQSSSSAGNTFDYNQADYSIFSQDSQKNKFYNPSEKFMKQKQRNKAFNSRTKRKRDFYISSNSQNVKKS